MKCSRCGAVIEEGTSCFVVTKGSIENGEFIEEHDVATYCARCFLGKTA